MLLDALHLRRSSSARSPSNPLRVTVSFSVEVTQEDQFFSLEEMDAIRNVEDDQRLYTPSVRLAESPEWLTTSYRAISQVHSRTDFAADALNQIAREEMRNFSTMYFLPPEPIFGRRVSPVEEVSRFIWTEVSKLTEFGQHQFASEELEAHAKAISTVLNDLHTSTVWVRDVQFFRNVDAPLFYFLCDSLYKHTPQDVFHRWDALRVHLSLSGQLLESLVRQAEQLPRKMWPSQVLEFYFLLLDHNKALAESTTIVEMDDDSIECRLSGYCTALRIRFYLWRMTRSDRMCRLRQYKEYVKEQGFRHHVNQILNLVSQEFGRIQDADNFESVSRRLVGESVTIAAITIPFTGTASEFCTICQDTHDACECVSPLQCKCVFGRDCLQPLLNRDTPSSYSCPNCRTRLHEPLQWQALPSSNDRILHIGLLWTLRHNCICLKNEILVEPDPFTASQHVVGFVDRLLYGR